MDGIRAYWDGFKLLSKQGKEIGAPASYTNGLPKGVTSMGSYGWAETHLMISLLS